jgi:hypothetical protein
MATTTFLPLIFCPAPMAYKIAKNHGLPKSKAFFPLTLLDKRDTGYMSCF